MGKRPGPAMHFHPEFGRLQAAFRPDLVVGDASFHGAMNNDDLPWEKEELHSRAER